MVPKTDPPTWTKAEQRELVDILGPDNLPLLTGLAWIVGRERRFADRLAHRESAEGQAEHLRTVGDKRRLQTAAVALDRAVDALSELGPSWSTRLAAALGADWLTTLTATRDRVQACVTPNGSKAPRHRPKGWPRLIADAVADVLGQHKVRITSAPNGRFARVLAVVFWAVASELDPDLDGLVRAVVQDRRRA
jgi:hypothetical protein